MPLPGMGGRPLIPLGQVAKVKLAGPRLRSAPRTRSSAAYIFVDVRERDLAATSPTRKKAVARQVKFPPGYYADLERPVRILRARQGAAGSRASR